MSMRHALTPRQREVYQLYYVFGIKGDFAAVLLIEHYIAQSSIHGLGTFAAKFVQKGQKVWEFHSAVNTIVPASDLAGLPLHVIDLFKARSEYLHDIDSFLTSIDGDQFVNHSDAPNTAKHGEDWFASRDIHPREEITCDYRQTLVLGFNSETGKPHSQLPAR